MDNSIRRLPCTRNGAPAMRGIRFCQVGLRYRYVGGITRNRRSPIYCWVDCYLDPSVFLRVQARGASDVSKRRFRQIKFTFA